MIHTRLLPNKNLKPSSSSKLSWNIYEVNLMLHFFFLTLLFLSKSLQKTQFDRAIDQAIRK